MEPLDVVNDIAVAIAKRLDGAEVTIDAPATRDGHWWLDVAHERRTATIEWRRKYGFGVGIGEGGYGEGPNVVFPRASDAAHYVVNKLTTGAVQRDVLIASSDLPWQSSLANDLTRRDINVELVSDLGEASRRIRTHEYTAVVIEVPKSESAKFAALRQALLDTDSLVIAVATVKRAKLFDDWFDMLVHKILGPEYISATVDSLASVAVLDNVPPEVHQSPDIGTERSRSA